jgi:hypothetical protein
LQRHGAGGDLCRCDIGMRTPTTALFPTTSVRLRFIRSVAPSVTVLARIRLRTFFDRIDQLQLCLALVPTLSSCERANALIDQAPRLESTATTAKREEPMRMRCSRGRDNAAWLRDFQFPAKIDSDLSALRCLVMCFDCRGVQRLALTNILSLALSSSLPLAVHSPAMCNGFLSTAWPTTAYTTPFRSRTSSGGHPRITAA